ncbi:MAG: hypothetical protein A2X49_09015 [Lentisphaerae bacterium GWF2_52_8]|nr:MAG: hypothetical protein A2X49_09015 [Lentisphaerae bacterium GWF2_52_8]
MNVKAVVNVVAAVTIVIGLVILSSIPVGWLMGDSIGTVWRFLVSGFLPIIIGTLMFFHTRNKHGYRMGAREGFGIVTFGWLAAAVFGSFPYIIVQDMYLHDAFFETMSGFTTTGASVLDNTLVLMSGEKLQSGIQDLPKGLLYWRAMTNWLGGMGIIVLSLAILPFLGIGCQKLYSAESTGFMSDQLTPRIATSAKILWGVYLVISIVLTFLLWAGGMPLFDSWCHTCATVATGGLSTQQASIGAYNSVYFDVVITIFMFICGANFVLYFKAISGQPICIFKDEEIRFYFLITILAIALITFTMIGHPIVTSAGKEVEGSFLNALRYASFQVVTLMSTCGFVSADYDQWSSTAKFVLVGVTLFGACGGSTAGGIKVSRVLLFLKYAFSQIQRCIFPRALTNVRFNEIFVEEPAIQKALCFILLYLGIFALCSLLLPLCSTMDMETAFSASAACLGNVGPGLGEFGPMYSAAWLSVPAKILLSIEMLVGRLEIFTVLVLFLPSFWRK